MGHEVFAGQVPAAKQLQDLAIQGSYVPELTATVTNPNLGADGIAEGSWSRNGHSITAYFFFQFSGTGVDPGSGSYGISMPFQFDGAFIRIATLGQVIGAGSLHDTSTDANKQPVAVSSWLFGPPSRVLLRPIGRSFVTHDLPILWATGDAIAGYVTYPATNLP